MNLISNPQIPKKSISLKGTIVCIDDEILALEVIRKQLFKFFGQEYEIELAQNGRYALQLIEELHLSEDEIPVVLCNHLIPDADEAILLKRLINLYPEILKIVITGQADISTISRCISYADLFGYITKPWKEINLLMVVREALRRYKYEKTIDKQTKRLELTLKEINILKQQLEEENLFSKTKLQVNEDFPQFIGKSECVKCVLNRIEKVVSSSTTVLILGETGTGKELIANAIYNHSPRRGQPFVKVNCAALPADLIESELFGHTKGAFTGAHMQKIGKFELANKGTIFLDEIGELPINLQAKILRTIESGEIEKLGGVKPTKIDVRIIAATNRDLEQEIENGNFRMDLYYRLNVYPVTLPPLRYRKEDIEPLVTYFVHIFNKKIGRNITKIPQKVLDSLIAYDWPGNVRELQNIIERSVILSQGSKLKVELPKGSKISSSKIKTLMEAERDAILHVLNLTSGKISGKSGAASYLNVNSNTLRSKMKRLGIEKRGTNFTG